MPARPTLYTPSRHAVTFGTALGQATTAVQAGQSLGLAVRLRRQALSAQGGLEGQGLGGC